MKGMIYRDGKFISVLSEIETESLYAELPRNKKIREANAKKKGKATKAKKTPVKPIED